MNAEQKTGWSEKALTTENFNHRDGMNKLQALRRYALGVGTWGRQVAGWVRAVRQYDLDTEISQTCDRSDTVRPV